tara:strand:- start:1119 stop:2555 length:1437 start_codon:yes stop_codon:yes gene_type:complete
MGNNKDLFKDLLLTESFYKLDISMLMVYFNECGRFVKNKLNLESFIPSSNTSILLKIKQRISNYIKWKNLSLNENVKEIDSVIHINEISHLREMIPVYNSLKEKYKVFFISNNLNTLEFIKSKSLPYFNLYNQYTFFENEIFYSSNSLRKDYKHAIDSIKVIDSKKSIKKFLKNKFIIYCNQNKWYTKLVKTYSFKFAVVANDLTSEGRLFTLVCKKNNISTFSIQHGNIYNDWISRHHIVDTFFTHGKLATNLLKKNNHFKTNIITSGSPFVYNLMNKKDLLYSKSHQLKNKYSLPESYILIALSGHGYMTSKKNYDKCLSAINNLIDMKKSNFFIIKLHKKENIHDYNFISGKPNVKIVYEKSPIFNLEFSIFPWIINSTMLITGSSTTAIESMLMNKPVISLDFNNEYSSVDFVKREASINVNTEDDLIKSFDNINKLHFIKMENSNNIVKDYFGNINKDSSKIIVNHIDSIHAS